MAVVQETSVETAIARTAWEDALDPSLRDAARKYLRSLTAYSRAFNSHQDEVIRVALQKRMAQFPHLARAIPSQSAVAGTNTTDFGFWVAMGALLFFAFLFLLRFEGPIVACATLLIGAVTSAVIYLRQKARTFDTSDVQGNRREPLLDAFLPQALEQMATKPNERAYVDAVLDLLPEQTNGYLFDEWRNEQMGNMLALLESSRQVEAVREQIRVVLKDTSLVTLRKEIAALRNRVEETTDEVTRSTLEQSLALCEEQLDRNKSLEIILQRLDAESELIHHTFGATRSMLTSLRLSPNTVANGTGISRSLEVAETIARQTRSVEAAVQELGIRNS